MNKLNKKTEWVEAARRGKNHAVFFIHSVMQLYHEGYLAKAHNIPWSPRCYRQFDGARSFSKKDAETYKSLMEKASHNKKHLLLKYAREFEKRIFAFRRFASKYKNANFKKLNNNQLWKILWLWREHNKRQWSFAYDYIFINKFLPDIITSAVSSKISDIHKLNYYLGILFEADKASEVRLEKQALVTLAQFIKLHKLPISHKIINEKISKYLKNFAHLGFYYFRGAAYAESDIKQRLKEYLLMDIAQLKKIRQDFVNQARNAQLTRQVIKKLGLDKKTREFVLTIKRWASLSNFADENYGYSVLALWQLWEEICKRLYITRNELYALSAEEVLAALKTKKLPPALKKELKIRIKENAVILEHGKIKILSGKTLQTYKKQQAVKQGKFDNIHILKGQPASPGKVKGKVRIVYTTHDVKKVERGNILVASATNPTYVPAMERAVAIVTDEGGLLSHAAIVSRELKIPCVVGTLIATKALKDGDLVEVDANKGIVKKLS